MPAPKITYVNNDPYTPHFQTTNFGDSFTDFLGITNNKAKKQAANNIEVAKAINMNKYTWNKEGMLAAGINPLIASSNLGSVSTGQPFNDTTNFVDMFTSILEIIPTIIKAVK